MGSGQADDGSFQVARPLDGPNEALFVVTSRRDDKLVRLRFARLCALDEASSAGGDANGWRRTLGHFSRLSGRWNWCLRHASEKGKGLKILHYD